MKYTLTKLSSPGFELNTNHIHIVRDVLDLYVCILCRRDKDWPNNFPVMSESDQIHVLLDTPCGAEFILEENHVEGVTTTHEVLF
jgi:hypothetical protein